jgi:hypothetical protein
MLTSPWKCKEPSKHIETLYLEPPQKTTLLLPPNSTGFYPDGNSPGKTLENSGKQNPKMGFKSPRAEEKIGCAAVCSSFADFLIDFEAKIDISVLMPRKLTIGKTSKISIFQRKTGRWIVDWHDEHGARRNPSFATLKEAEAFQKQKRAELERHREGRFNLDDREMLSQARNLASRHGYTVLQAVQEWHSSKGSSESMPLGKVIEKFLDAKSFNRTAQGRLRYTSSNRWQRINRFLPSGQAHANPLKRQLKLRAPSR